MKELLIEAAEVLEKLLEKISQQSEGGCAFCFADDFPVKGDKKGYDDVPAEDAEEWHIEHYENCPVLQIEAALAAIKGE